MTRKSSLRDLLESGDKAIREGRVPEARQMLGAINTAKVPRELRLIFANLCRRIGLNETGLKTLTPAMSESPSPQERAEYALLLQRVGSIDESLRRLEELSGEVVPESLLYRSFCHFNRWEYHLALPLLQNYVRGPIAPYQALVGRVNLAAALSATELYTDATELLTSLISETRAAGHRRLEGNCHEIQAQTHIMRNDLPQARASLELAADLLRGEGTFNENAVIKWRAVIEAIESRSIAPLVAFRDGVCHAQDFEAFRHIDLHILRVSFDKDLFHYHLFGSPWLGYREHAQRILGRIVQNQDFLHGSVGDQQINLITGEVTGAEPLPFGGALHCTLDALTRDFYRPIPVAGLFSLLFAGEFFDPFSSPNRVHQAVFRLRKWIENTGLSLTIDLNNNSYKLRKTGAVALYVPYQRKKPDANAQLLKAVRDHFSTGFSLKEGAEKMNVPPSALRAFCTWAIANGHLEKIGAGRTTLYIPAGLRDGPH